VLLGIGLFASVAMAGCTGRDSPPRVLVDGTPTAEPAVRLQAPTPQIQTKVAVVDYHSAKPGTQAAQCLATVHDHVSKGHVVERIGVNGASVTLRTSSTRGLIACDRSAGHRAGESRWCGRAFGRVAHGRLRDPRLDLASCLTVDGGPIAFAWFEPGRDTAYVAVRQHGYVEVYRVAGGLPLRLTTASGIDLETSSARFEVSEHDGGGTLLRSSVLDARVAG
jgi:hypothetical protein